MTYVKLCHRHWWLVVSYNERWKELDDDDDDDDDDVDDDDDDDDDEHVDDDDDVFSSLPVDDMIQDP